MITLSSPLPIAPTLGAVESNSLWSMIQQGGWAMYPLAACSLVLIYLIIHCYRETTAKRFGSEGFARNISILIGNERLTEARQAVQTADTTLARALASALPKLRAPALAREIEQFEIAVDEQMEVEETAISQWIHYLNVIANVSPMVGLLGTVSGMIGGFQTMSAGGMGRPELFAGDIGEALITTATGLCIGIPAMIAHSYFNNRLNTQIVETTRRARSVTDSLGVATESVTNR